MFDNIFDKDFLLPPWAVNSELTKTSTARLSRPREFASPQMSSKENSRPPFLDIDILGDEILQDFVTSDVEHITTVEELAAIAAMTVLVAQDGVDLKGTEARTSELSLQFAHNEKVKAKIAKNSKQPKQSENAESAEIAEIAAKADARRHHHKRPNQLLTPNRSRFTICPTGPGLRAQSRNTTRRPLCHRRNQRSRSGCWTCRFRHKACPEDGMPCATCKRLHLPCDNSVERPPYMVDKKVAAIHLQMIRSKCRRKSTRW